MPPSGAAAELADARAERTNDFRSEGEASNWDSAFFAADVITAIASGALAGGGVNLKVSPYQADQGAQGAKSIYDAKFRRSKITVRPNPLFQANGFFEDEIDDDGEKIKVDPRTHSPVTTAYLQSRSFKAVAGAALSLGGSFASTHTAGVNVASGVKHTSALITTGIHWYGIEAIAKANRQTKTVSDWCNLIIRAKRSKAISRGINLAGSVIPVPAVGTLASVLAASMKLGVKIRYPEMCYLMAIEIHWRAYQEQKISAVLGPRVPVFPNFSKPTGMRSGPGSKPAPGATRSANIKVGPASRIFAELFKRRGATVLLGTYNVSALINEPGGWMALGDKIVAT